MNTILAQVGASETDPFAGLAKSNQISANLELHFGDEKALAGKNATAQ